MLQCASICLSMVVPICFMKGLNLVKGFIFHRDG